MKNAVFLVVIAFGAIALALWAASAISATTSRPITLAEVCTGYALSKRGDDVLIRCPGEAQPWLTIKGCRNPKVLVRTATKVVIQCDFGF